MDPEIGKCCWTDEQLATPITKLQEAIKAAQEGTFIPDRENDELKRPSGILSTLDEHVARQAPLRGRLGFSTQAVTKSKR